LLAKDFKFETVPKCPIQLVVVSVKSKMDCDNLSDNLPDGENQFPVTWIQTSDP
jgi:hypothetical protein